MNTFLFLVFTVTAASPASQYMTGEEIANQILPASAAVYEASWQAWQNRPPVPQHQNPNLLEYYILNDEFRAILTTGPEIIPYLIANKERGIPGHYDLQTLLRAHIAVMEGKTGKEEFHLSDELLYSWWSDAVIQSGTYYREKRAKLDTLLASLATVPSATAVQDYRAWKELEAMGILGIPHAVKRLADGSGDHWDALLLTWWTRPIRYTADGWPVLAYRPKWTPVADRVPLPRAIEDPRYWTNWWEKNKGEYWWLLTKDELAALRAKK